jgi:hypothetical protein
MHYVDSWSFDFCGILRLPYLARLAFGARLCDLAIYCYQLHTPDGQHDTLETLRLVRTMLKQKSHGKPAFVTQPMTLEQLVREAERLTHARHPAAYAVALVANVAVLGNPRVWLGISTRSVVHCLNKMVSDHHTRCGQDLSPHIAEDLLAIQTFVRKHRCSEDTAIPEHVFGSFSRQNRPPVEPGNGPYPAVPTSEHSSSNGAERTLRIVVLIGEVVMLTGEVVRILDMLGMFRVLDKWLGEFAQLLSLWL